MRPFFPYYGAKWMLAPKYPAPAGRTVIEPFAGSAAYSVRHDVQRAVLLDAGPVLAGVWSPLIGASQREILALPDLANEQRVADLPLCQEARDFVGFWLNRGSAAPAKRPHPPNGLAPGKSSTRAATPARCGE